MKRLALFLAVLLSACSEAVTIDVIEDSQLRCQNLGGLSAVSMTYSRSYFFVEAHCKNGSIVKTTIKRS
jgi:hypothetical protein